MEGRYNDGQTARTRVLAVHVEDGALVFEAEGVQRWLLAAVSAEVVDDKVRLARGDGGAERLSLSLADWRAVAGDSNGRIDADRRRRILLVATLTASAAAIAVLVFVGVPAASGPLARATPVQMEAQIGENFRTQMSFAFKPCKGEAGQAALQRLGGRLRQASGTPFDIRVRAVDAPIVNAFALPGGSVMVTGKLIEMVRTPDELSAVIAHEAAHVQRRHVMQAVWRAFGFGVLLDAIVGGGSGAGQQAVLLFGSFTNLSFNRQAEAEADATGQALLAALHLSSEGMAPFFRRLAAAERGANAAAVKELISDHPDSLRRAAESQARARPGEQAFTPAEWNAIKAACS